MFVQGVVSAVETVGPALVVENADEVVIVANVVMIVSEVARVADSSDEAALVNGFVVAVATAGAGLLVDELAGTAVDVVTVPSAVEVVVGETVAATVQAV